MPHGIPDFCALTDTRILVPAGQSVTLSASTQTSCLGIHGTVTLTGSLLVDNLLVYADGTLIVEGGEIVIRDRAIDTLTDPEQFGQGVIGFGKVTLAKALVRSENPQGTRGHVLLTQRADVTVTGSRFLDLGRTCTNGVPLNPAYDAAGVAIPLADPTCQIGRYALHLHHVMGPFPATSDRQFRIIGNTFERGGKWGGVTLHNSHFGLIQANVCVQSTGPCYVEEDGGETDNHWIGNYAGQSIGAPCFISPGTGADYDPFGLCPSGFWLRASRQVLRNNVVEDVQRGISWWTVCLETTDRNHPCNSPAGITIPKFPGADTTDPAQREVCNFAENLSGVIPPCRPGYRVGMTVDGNIIRRAAIGIEAWWTSRIEASRNGIYVTGPERNGISPPITNTVTEDVERPIEPHYTDWAFDGFTATGCAWLVSQFNDFSPASTVRVESVFRNMNATCSQGVWRRIGQLAQAPALRFNGTFTTPQGIQVGIGGQGSGLNSVVTAEHSTFSGPIFTVLPNGFEFNANQTITLHAVNANGQSFTRTLTAGVVPDVPAPPPPPVVVPPPPPVDPCVATPLKVTAIKWPSQPTGSRSGSWNSGAFTLTEAAFLWSPQRFRATDARGCSVTVTR